MAVHYSQETREWSTPQALYDELNAEFKFNLDPCCTEDNAKCALHFTEKQDGLNQPWAPHRVFMNPPYGYRIKFWMKKAYEESLLGALVVCLVPARTDTAWWHDYAMKGEVRFIRGRICFGNGTGSAPFPNAIVIFRPSSSIIRKTAMKDFLGFENARNKANAALYTRILQIAYPNQTDVLVGHHLCFEKHGDIQTENEIPSADTLIFDHEIMRAVFPNDWREVLAALAREGTETRDILLARLIRARDDKLEDASDVLGRVA